MKKIHLFIITFILAFNINTPKAQAGLPVIDISQITQDLIQFIQDIQSQFQQYQAQIDQLTELYKHTEELLKQTTELETLNDHIGHAKRVLYGIREIDEEVRDIYGTLRGIVRDSLPDEEVDTFEEIYGKEDEKGIWREPENPYTPINEAIARTSRVLGGDAELLRDKRTRLGEEITELTTLLDNAETDQEIQKYTGLLLGHQAKLMAVMAEESKLSNEVLASYVQRQAAKDLEDVKAEEEHSNSSFRSSLNTIKEQMSAIESVNQKLLNSE